VIQAQSYTLYVFQNEIFYVLQMTGVREEWHNDEFHQTGHYWNYAGNKIDFTRGKFKPKSANSTLQTLSCRFVVYNCVIEVNSWSPKVKTHHIPPIVTHAQYIFYKVKWCPCGRLQEGPFTIVWRCWRTISKTCDNLFSGHLKSRLTESFPGSVTDSDIIPKRVNSLVYQKTFMKGV